MKYSMHRSHRARPEEAYENHIFGATVEFDEAVEELPPKYKKKGGVQRYLADVLDDLLEPAAHRAVESGVTEESHIREYYQITD